MVTTFGTTAAAQARQTARLIAVLLVAAVLILGGQVAHASDPTGAGHGATSPPTRDPLAGRFGSSLDDFEAAYGEPLDSDPRPYPIGQAYAISDFGGGTAYAFFADDRLIYLTYLPENGPQSALDLPSLLEAFLPIDYSNGWIGDETGESFVVNVQSADLADVVGADTYDAFDGGIWVGDLHAFVRTTLQGEVTSIEFGLGWGPPDVEAIDLIHDQDDDDPADDRSDAADTEDDDPYGARSDAETEYLTTVAATFETLTESMERYDAVLNDPTFGDADSINDLIDIISTWDFAHRDAQALTPPPGFEELHEAYLDFTKALHRAARKIAAEDFDSAAVELTVAQEQAEIVVALLEEAARPGFFDIKSGHVQR